jgi:hypothetical protein
MALPLARLFSGPVIHDWHYLLGRTGLLAWDATLAFLLRLAASCCMLAALAAGGWLLWVMARSRRGAPGRPAASA